MVRLFRNGVLYAEGTLTEMMKYFASPCDEPDTFQSAIEQFEQENEFEFVLNNNVYSIEGD